MEQKRKPVLVIGPTLEAAKAQMERLGIEDYETWDEYNKRKMEDWELLYPDDNPTGVEWRTLATLKRHSEVMKHMVSKGTLPHLVATTDQHGAFASKLDIEVTKGVPLPEIALFVYHQVWAMSVAGWTNVRDATGPTHELTNVPDV